MPLLTIPTFARGTVDTFGKALATPSVQMFHNALRAEDHRAWFAFNLPVLPGTLTAAALRLQVTKVDPPAPQGISLWHFVGDLDKLIAKTGTDREWVALGSGILLRQIALTPADAGTGIEIPLNRDAVSSISTAANSRFAIGAALVTVPNENPPKDHLVAGPAQPVPSDWKTVLVLDVVGAVGAAPVRLR